MKRSARASLLATASCLAALGALGFPGPPHAHGIGDASRVDVRGVLLGDRAVEDEPRPSARRRIAWEARKRTSIETRLRPTATRLDDPALIDSPLLYLAGDEAFDEPSEAEVRGLRRFLTAGGMVIIDDAEPARPGFDASIRALLRRAFPARPLRPIPSEDTVFRTFYLLDEPAGRVRHSGALEGIEWDGRWAVVYNRNDMGGAWARDNLGTWQHAVEGGAARREMAIRLGVNLIMYALCLDYKDDQVHAPFIMRRRGATP